MVAWTLLSLSGLGVYSDKDGCILVGTGSLEGLMPSSSRVPTYKTCIYSLSVSGGLM